MYENEKNQVAERQLGLVAVRRVDITIGENLDARIADAEKRLQELKDTKERIAETGLLTARIDDLQRAMNY